MAESGPTIGSVVGEYRIVRKLGEGGMGVVYLAQDTRLGREVALKTLAREYVDDPERRRRFVNEARAAAALTHAGVAAVYDLKEDGKDLFIVFETMEEFFDELARAQQKLGGKCLITTPWRRCSRRTA